MLSGPQARLLYGAFLALLLANDWLVKPSGSWPALSGKLSDFAGLVVAPVTLCWFLRWLGPETWSRRSQRGRWFSFTATALLFAAINVSPLLSDWVVHGLATLGLCWHLWPDPTDLIALVVLPVAWVMVEALEREGVQRWGVRGMRDFASLSVGAIACMASGVPDPSDTGMGFIVNASGVQLQLRTSRLQGQRDCGSERVLFEDDVLRSDDFARPGTIGFEVGAAFHLFPRNFDRAWGGGSDTPCNPVRIAVWPESGDETEAVSVVVEAEEGGPRQITERPTAEELRDPYRLVQVVRTSSGLELQVGPGLRALRLAEGEAPKPPDECALNPSPRVSAHEVRGVVNNIEPVGDRCFDIALERQDAESSNGGAGGASSGDGLAEGAQGGYGGNGGDDSWRPPERDGLRRFSLCVDVHVPFRVGELLSVTPSPVWGAEAFRIASETASIVVASHDRYEEVAPTTCPQVRDTCGAIWVTEDAVVPTPSGAVHGRDLAVDASGVHVVNTYRVLLGREECPRHLATPIRRAEWVETSY